jgi:hypothetical protein
MSKIIQNAVYIPEDDLYLNSVNVHDFREWSSDKDGASFFIDGGCEYFRSCDDILGLLASGRVIDYNLTTDDPFEIIAAKLLWGSRGLDGKSPLSYRPIMDLTLDHLHAILVYPFPVDKPLKGTLAEKVIQYWVEQKTEEQRQIVGDIINTDTTP